MRVEVRVGVVRRRSVRRLGVCIFGGGRGDYLLHMKLK